MIVMTFLDLKYTHTYIQGQFVKQIVILQKSNIVQKKYKSANKTMLMKHLLLSKNKTIVQKEVY